MGSALPWRLGRVLPVPQRTAWPRTGPGGHRPRERPDRGAYAHTVGACPRSRGSRRQPTLPRALQYFSPKKAATLGYTRAAPLIRQPALFLSTPCMRRSPGLAALTLLCPRIAACAGGPNGAMLGQHPHPVPTPTAGSAGVRRDCVTNGREGAQIRKDRLQIVIG